MTNSTQKGDMDSGEQTHKEKLKLNDSQSMDYVGLIHLFIRRNAAHWLNHGHKACYEIEGFITREEDRHRTIKALEIKNNEMLPDHKIVEVKLKAKIPRHSNGMTLQME